MTKSDCGVAIAERGIQTEASSCFYHVDDNDLPTMIDPDYACTYVHIDLAYRLWLLGVFGWTGL